nr:hypothetical protein [Sorangium cellulosum]
MEIHYAILTSSRGLRRAQRRWGGGPRDAIEVVVSAIAGELVVPAIAEQSVVAGAAGDDVITAPTFDGLVARVTTQGVVTGAAEQMLHVHHAV